MNKQWLELEEYIKQEMKLEGRHDDYIKWPYFRIIQCQMDRIKSEAYYQSLKEAGYF